MKRVLVYSRLGCPHCKAAKALLDANGIPYHVVDTDEFPQRRKEVIAATGVASVPQIFFASEFVGGNAELQAVAAAGELNARVALSSVPVTAEGPLPPYLLTPEEYAAAMRYEDSPPSVTGVEGGAGLREMSGPPVVPAVVAPPPPSPLDVLYDAMRHRDTGIAVGSHRVLFASRPRCVRGDALLTWLRGHRADSRVSPLDLAQSMLQCGMISSLNLDVPFKPDETLYRLQADVEPKRALLPFGPPTPLPPDAAALFSSIPHAPVAGPAAASARLVPVMDLPSVCEVGPLNMGYVYHGPTLAAEGVAEELRRLIAALFEQFSSVDGKAFDYAGLKRSTTFANYVRSSAKLQRVDVFALSPSQRQAFFINIYNVLVIHAIALYGHPPTAAKRWVFFSYVSYRIGPYTFTLNDMEHGVLRSNSRAPAHMFKQFSSSDPRLRVALPVVDPRIHFALVCGAKSCPSLSVFRAEDISESLTVAARSFLADPSNFHVDPDAGVVAVSSLFKWYGGDFGPTPRETVLRCVAHLPRPVAVALEAVVTVPTWKLVYLPYNWDPNEDSAATKAHAVGPLQVPLLPTVTH